MDEKNDGGNVNELDSLMRKYVREWYMFFDSC